jgi:hypothetical protein
MTKETIIRHKSKETYYNPLYILIPPCLEICLVIDKQSIKRDYILPRSYTA